MGNITQLHQGSLSGLRRQTNECIDSAYRKGYEDGKKEPREVTNVEDTNEYQIGYKAGKKDGIAYCRNNTELIDELKQVEYNKGFEDGNKIADKDLKDIQDSTYDVAYNKALDDVNHAIDVLKNMTVEECEEWFGGCVSIDDVFCTVDIQGIIRRTNTYEEKKKADEESIKVGDEIVCNCPNEQRVIITAICDGWVTFMRKDGACYSRADKDLKKTGRHFDEVEQLLDKLRGENND